MPLLVMSIIYENLSIFYLIFLLFNGVFILLFIQISPLNNKFRHYILKLTTENEFIS